MNPDLMLETQKELREAGEKTPVYERVRLTRKSGRATGGDYIRGIFTDFTELHGDRRFGDDASIIAGIGYLGNSPVTVVAVEKGRDPADRVRRNFGFVSAEGYRKALRLARQAEKFGRPVVFFVDTQGADCGPGAEERGIGEAIAENLYTFGSLRVPMVSVLIGEGGSGGALGLAVADEVWMTENAYYSVITPESCASILYKDSSRAAEVAEHLKLTAADLLKMEVIERIILEPKDFSDGAAVGAFMKELRTDLQKKIMLLRMLPKEKLLENRYEKYRKIGRYAEYSTESRGGWVKNFPSLRSRRK